MTDQEALENLMRDCATAGGYPLDGWDTESAQAAARAFDEMKKRLQDAEDFKGRYVLESYMDEKIQELHAERDALLAELKATEHELKTARLEMNDLHNRLEGSE